MATNRFQLILFAAAIAMILHTVEELITKIYNADPFIMTVSNYYRINPLEFYLTGQILVLSLIFLLLILTFYKKFNKPLAIILGLVFFLELLHPYNSIMIKGYYSGLYTGIILVIIGFFYWKELINTIKQQLN